MDRRTFLRLTGGAAAVLPFGAAAQNPQVRLVGALMAGRESDPSLPGFVNAFRLGLADAGWVEPGNVRSIIRYAAASRPNADAYAAEIVAMAPDAIFANTTLCTAAVLAVTRTIPVVFVPISDPVGAGFVESYARPGGNATGFTNFEPSHAGKWLDYLRSIVPGVTTAGIMYNPASAPRQGEYFGPAFEEAAAAMGVRPLRLPVNDVAEIGPAAASLAAERQSGLVVASDIYMSVNRLAVLAAVNEHRLPAIYPFVNYTDDGGLVSYSIDTLDAFRRAAAYLGRVLDGDDVATLPVQAPQRFQLVLNLRTAAAQGIVIPSTLLSVADRVME